MEGNTLIFLLLFLFPWSALDAAFPLLQPHVTAHSVFLLLQLFKFYYYCYYFRKQKSPSPKQFKIFAIFVLSVEMEVLPSQNTNWQGGKSLTEHYSSCQHYLFPKNKHSVLVKCKRQLVKGSGLIYPADGLVSTHHSTRFLLKFQCYGRRGGNYLPCEDPFFSDCPIHDDILIWTVSAFLKEAVSFSMKITKAVEKMPS